MIITPVFGRTQTRIHLRIEFCGINIASLSGIFCGTTANGKGLRKNMYKISLWNSWRLRVVSPFWEHINSRKKESLTHSLQIDVVKSLPINFQLHTNARTLRALLLSNLIIFPSFLLSLIRDTFLYIKSRVNTIDDKAKPQTIYQFFPSIISLKSWFFN